MTSSRRSSATGDDAVRSWALELDGVEPARAVPRPDLLPREALLALADRVRRWHEAQRPADISLEVEPGVTLERRWVPLSTVGIYVPRNLISTLVMCAVPAQAAGVERLVVCTPPAGAGLIAAAAEVLGIDEVWALGGPQAIGWLAYVRKVDKIVGPGNAHVNEAKLAVQRDVAIDLPGWSVRGRRCRDRRRRPADRRARARGAGRARPRHGLPRRRDARGGGGDRARAPRAARSGRGARRTRCGTPARCSSAPSSPVAAGDYATGGNHVLPTSGWARSVGGLGIETFLKPVTVQRITPEGLALLPADGRGAGRGRGHAGTRGGGAR